MADKPLSLQDQFLNALRRGKTPATIFLVKGVKLQGIITWFDAFSLLLRRDGSNQLVYKHAVSTIMPAQAPEDLPVPVVAEQSNARRPALQDLFLQAAERQREPMTIFLVNGVMLQGSIAGFDQFSLILERGGQVQLVYKHAVSTMQPAQPLNLGGGEESAGDED